MTSNHRIILHIVYIHGFQGLSSFSSATTQKISFRLTHTKSFFLLPGDHTTFQSFPTDLHNALQPTMPEHIELRSILYPTYKSKKPIAVATEKFLQWCVLQVPIEFLTQIMQPCRLEALPAGPVILCGHSMGGLLAAEAATSSVHVSKRVVALLAFDVPFLGMHPHVVVSGLASLLPHQKREGGRHDNVKAPLKTEKEMNDAHVDIEPVTQSSCKSNPSFDGLLEANIWHNVRPLTKRISNSPIATTFDDALTIHQLVTDTSTATATAIFEPADTLQRHATSSLASYVRRYLSHP